MKIRVLKHLKPVPWRWVLGISLMATGLSMPQCMKAFRGHSAPVSNRLAVEFVSNGADGSAEYVSFVDNGEGGGVAGNGSHDGTEKVVQRGFMRYLPDTPRKK